MKSSRPVTRDHRCRHPTHTFVNSGVYRMYTSLQSPRSIRLGERRSVERTTVVTVVTRFIHLSSSPGTRHTYCSKYSHRSYSVGSPGIRCCVSTVVTEPVRSGVRRSIVYTIPGYHINTVPPVLPYVSTVTVFRYTQLRVRG